MAYYALAFCGKEKNRTVLIQIFFVGRALAFHGITSCVTLLYALAICGSPYVAASVSSGETAPFGACKTCTKPSTILF